jgi:hypothetical protein
MREHPRVMRLKIRSFMTTHLHSARLSALVIVLATSTAMATSPPPSAGPQDLVAESDQAELDTVRYARAAQELDAAYRLKPSGPLCLKSAQAYQLAGALLDAQGRYYDCLEASDLSSEQRGEISITLLSIRQLLEADGATPSPRRFSPYAPAPSPAAPPEVFTEPVVSAGQEAGPMPSPEQLSTTSQPLSYTERPLTLPGGTWSFAGGAGVGRFWGSDETSLGITAAMSYGIVDAFELGTFVMQLQLLERVVYDRPSLYAIAQLFNGQHFTIGAKLEVVAGIQSYSPWTVTIGIPQHYYPTERLRLELGLYVEFVQSETRLTNFHVPASLDLQVTDAVFGSLSTSFVLIDGEQVVIPLGLGIGYTFERDQQPLCDLRAEFQWPLFHQPSSERPMDLDTLTAGLNVRCFLYD